MKGVSQKLVTDLAVFAVSNVALYYTLKYMMAHLNPQSQSRLNAKKTSDEKLRLMGKSAGKLDLNEYEEQIAAEIILPSQIDVDFESIGGLEHIITSLQESVIAPLCQPELFQSGGDLLQAPKGVLLFGPPGTGKTMLAKALAKESGATFINMHVSTLMNKWFGESNKLVAALFSLARRLQPSIIFIDEIDSFLSSRKMGDHEITATVKAEFMTLWDGLTSGSDQIIVMGATNRPGAIDDAILRRMPKKYPVLLPNAQQRRQILEILLKRTQLDASFSYDAVVKRTEGQSGSDLKEMCRAAAMAPVTEFLRSAEGKKYLVESRTARKQQREKETGADTPSSSSSSSSTPPQGQFATRAVTTQDFFDYIALGGVQAAAASQPHLRTTEALD